MAKSEFLQIRLTPEDRQHIDEQATAEHLDASTWARRVILLELERLVRPAPAPAKRGTREH